MLPAPSASQPTTPQDDTPSPTTPPATVHFSAAGAGAGAEVSRVHRSSRSDHDDTSSYELDLLLQKWQRTMRVQGIRLPTEWEADLQEDSARLRELRLGLREARRRYKGRQKQRQAADPSSTDAASDDDADDDDRSVFTPADGWWARAWARMRAKVASAAPQGGPARGAAEHSYSASHTSTSSNGSDVHSVSCRCPACQRHRFTVRLFGCGGQFSEVVQLQLTFGAMLLRLRNSALRLEQANASKRSFLRFVFHEVRVPLNALGLGIEQLHDIVVTRQEQHRQHARHIAQTTQLLQRIEGLVHGGGSTAQLPSLLSQLDDLRYHCPLCCEPERNAESMDGGSLALLLIVQDQVATVTRILNDVLSFQRIEDGEMKLETSPFHVQTMVDNTLHSFQAEFRQKQLKVTTEWVDRTHRATPAPEPSPTTADEVRLEVREREGVEDREEGVQMSPLQRPPALAVTKSASSPRSEGEAGWWVMGDQYRLRQVLSNFVSNGVKFSATGGELVITGVLSSHSSVDAATQPVFDATLPGADQRCYLQLSVRDTGIGINAAGLASLFQPYRQIRPGALQEGKGSGLGLSICKKIVELHGGGVLVTSKPGEGSKFSFEVPVERLDGEKAAALAAAGQAALGGEQAREDSFVEGEEEESKHAARVEEGEEPRLYPVAPQHRVISLATPDLPSRSLRASPPPGTVSEEGEPGTAPPPYALGEFSTPSEGAGTTAAAPPAKASSPMVLDVDALPDAFRSDESRRESDLAAHTPTAAGAVAAPAKTAQVSATERLPTRRLGAPREASAVSAAHTPLGGGRALAAGNGGSAAEGVAPLRALVVEDSAVNRKLLVMMCQGLGLQVDSAEDGQFAYELIAANIAEAQRLQAQQTQEAAVTAAGGVEAGQQPPTPTSAVDCAYDVIFMDDHMPRMTGVECVAALRALGVAIPVFGITANALLEDQQRFMRAGVTAVVTKPMKKAQLVGMIDTAKGIRAKQVRKTSQSAQSSAPPL